MKLTVEVDEKYYELLHRISPLVCSMDMLILKDGKPTEERKTGKWIVKPKEYGRAFCSACDYELRINDTKYCPNCGAKMEVDK